MKKLNIDEIKQYSFEVLCVIRDICEKHDIRYSLTGGTLIGAVRHKGFIPWDDDIDIMMPRADYDRFISIVKQMKDLPVRILAEEICPDDYYYAWAKACHKKTELIEKDVEQTNAKLGVYVDIFPVDGMGYKYNSAKIRTMIFQFIHGLKLSSNWTKYHRSKLRKWYYEPLRYVCYLVSKILGKKLINRVLDRFVRKIPFEKSEYAGRLTGDFGSKEIMKKELFDKYIKLEFEGQLFNAIEDYDTFLTSLYGDYMKLPPEEARISHHEFEAYQV